MVRVSPWPESNLSKAWGLAVRTLQGNAFLQPVRSWRVWSGGKEDTTPFEWDELPAIRLTPSLGPARWMEEQAHRFQLNIKVEFAQQGTDAGNFLDFWATICNALIPPDGTNDVLDSLVPFGVFQTMLSGPVPEPVHFDNGGMGLSGSGQLQLLMRFDS